MKVAFYLEKEIANHSSILAWEIPWTEEPGRLQSMGSQRVRCDFTFPFYIKPLLRDPVGEGKSGMNGESSIDIYTLLLLSRFSRVRHCVTP